MRKLGAELGVEAMSLYHYVSNKDDLLDAVVELLLSEIEVPPDGGEPFSVEGWKREVASALRSFYDVLLRHPAGVELIGHRPIRGEAGFLVLYWAYSQCAKLGLSTVEASRMFNLVVSYVMGRAASETGMMSLIRDNPDETIAAVEDPEVREFLRCNREIDFAELFDFGLDVLLDGLLERFGVSEGRAAAHR